jgi:GNAT superfamily N-acetyltransferase
MQHTGPWSDSITFLGERQRQAFRQHLTRLDREGRLQRFGCLPSPASLVTYVDQIDLNRELVFCVKVDKVIRGAIQLRPLDVLHSWRPGRPIIYQATLSVEEDWRRQGMGMALLIRALSVVRRSGCHALLIDGLCGTVALRQLATRLGGELTFNDRACQAWFHLTPDDEDMIDLITPPPVQHTAELPFGGGIGH